MGNGMLCSFHGPEYPWAEVLIAYKAATWGWCFSFLEHVARSTSSSFSSRPAMVVVMHFQFPLPPLSIKLLEAASSPSLESQIPVYLFSIPFVFSSDPVSDNLIYRRSFCFQLEPSPDPKQSQRQKPRWLHAASLFAPWSQFTNIIKLFDGLEQNPQFLWDLESTSHLLHVLKTPWF